MVKKEVFKGYGFKVIQEDKYFTVYKGNKKYSTFASLKKAIKAILEYQ